MKSTLRKHETGRLYCSRDYHYMEQRSYPLAEGSRQTENGGENGGDSNRYKQDTIKGCRKKKKKINEWKQKRNETILTGRYIIIIFSGGEAAIK